MSESLEFYFIGWVNEGSHDKVWASFKSGPNFYCTWGRRGKRLSFKQHPSIWSLKNIQNKKISEGYREVDKFLLATVFPEFEENVEQELTIKMLSGKIL